MSDDAQSSVTTPTERVYLDAELRPHRSLGPTGFLLVMGAVALGGFSVGLAFFLAGAWPVAGFCGLEILLVYLAFRANFRSARRREHLRLTDNGLEVRCVDPSGRQRLTTMEPTWLSVRIDEPPRHDSQLVLQTKGQRMVVGSFLLPGERADLAAAIRRALDDYRAPDHLKPSYL